MGFRWEGRGIELDRVAARRHWFHSGWDLRRQITDSVQHKVNLCAIIATG